MSPLPTDRDTTDSAADHVADHNTLHAEYNTPTHTHSGTYGARTAYTPVLTAATTNPTLGTGGAAVGSYNQNGKEVFGRAYISFGTSGENAGSGTYRVSLPVNPISVAQNVIIGAGIAWDNSAGALQHVIFYVPTGATYAQMYLHTGAPVATNGAPFAWAANDHINVDFHYEAA